MYLRFTMNDDVLSESEVVHSEFTVECDRYSMESRRIEIEGGAAETCHDISYNGETMTLSKHQFDTCYVMNDKGETVTKIRSQTTYSSSSLLNML